MMKQMLGVSAIFFIASPCFGGMVDRVPGPSPLTAAVLMVETLIQTTPAEKGSLAEIAVELRRLAPSDWTVESVEKAIKFRSPRKYEGSDNGALILWFSDSRIDLRGFEIAADYLGHCHLGHAYLSRSPAAREEWSDCKVRIREQLQNSTLHAPHQAENVVRPRLSVNQLAELRRERVTANNLTASAALIGKWILTLPRGYQHEISIAQQVNGHLIIDCAKAINTRGRYTFSRNQLELIEPKVENVEDFIWLLDGQGHLVLIHEQHGTGGIYVGAVMQRVMPDAPSRILTQSETTARLDVPAVVSPAKDQAQPGASLVSRSGKSVTWKTAGQARRQSNDRESVKEWVGTWKLRLPAEFEYDVTLRQTEEGLIQIDCPIPLTLLGKFALNQEQQLLLVETSDDGIDDFNWKLNDHGEFVLVYESHRVGARYVGAILTRVKR